MSRIISNPMTKQNNTRHKRVFSIADLVIIRRATVISKNKKPAHYD